MQYLGDARIMYRYLCLDFMLYAELFVRTGGDYIPPHISKPIFEMGFWGNPSKFLMVKLYTLFGALSAFNFYNISLFFAFMAFVSKMILVKAAEKMNCSKEVVFLSLLVLFMIPYDSLEICGMHKENLTFLCVAYGIVFYRLEKNILNSSVFFILMVHLFILRSYIGAILLVYAFVLIFFKLLAYKKRMAYSFMLFVLISGSFIVHHFQILAALIYKKQRFGLYAKGRTKLEILHMDQDILSNILVVFKSIGRVFYFPNIHPLMFSDWGVIISNGIIILVIVSALFFQRIRSKFIYRLLVFVCFSVFFVIGFYVPNYGAIIRYRAVFAMMLLWGMIVSLDVKGMRYIQILWNLSRDFFNRFRLR